MTTSPHPHPPQPEPTEADLVAFWCAHEAWKDKWYNGAGPTASGEAGARFITAHVRREVEREAEKLRARVAELESLLQQMLDVAENCDETGYADGVGFVHLEMLHEEVRATLTRNDAREKENT